MYETLPVEARLPLFLLKMRRIWAAVRVLLSVAASTITATPLGAYPSQTISSKFCASLPSPVPRLIARSILSFGMLCARAAWIALRRRGFALGSPPPVLAAIVISFDNLLKTLPRFASIAPLNRLTFDHLLCPDMDAELPFLT